MSNHTARRRMAAFLGLFIVAIPGIGLAEGRFSDARLIVGKQQVEGILVSDTRAKQVSFDSSGSLPFQIPFDQIKSIRYERSATPRYAAGILVAWPFLFTKSKQHFLTIQYAGLSGEGKYQSVRLDKNNVRAALDTIEADTGVTIARSEER
jgi:sporulation protein YlmC with PRC-barrel domain